MKQLILKPGREKSLLRRHPWIFSGAVARVQGDPDAGDSVAVRAAGGEFLAWAAYSPASQIRARVWSWHEAERIDADLLRARLRQALAARARLLRAGDSDAMRIVHGESDGLPGVIVDRYGDVVVLQLLSAGAERWRGEFAEAVRELTGCACVYERSDADVRELEGLPAQQRRAPRRAARRRRAAARARPRLRRGCGGGAQDRFLSRPARQPQTRRRAQPRARGAQLFLLHRRLQPQCARGRRASVLSVDSSAEALAQARDNLARNDLDAARAEWQEADVFKQLRVLRDQGRSFDLIVLDPPKFAPTAAFAEKAARGYKDINLLALQAAARQADCSRASPVPAASRADLFQKILAGAALDAGVDASIVGHFAAAADHPVLLSFPEGDYLKGLLLRRA